MSRNCAVPVAILAVLGVFLLVLTMPALSAAPKADIIFVHGRIYEPPRQDSAHLDCAKLPMKLPAGGGLPCASHSYAEALAVKDGKILAVGDTKTILKWKGKHTTVLDLKGQFVLPGFNSRESASLPNVVRKMGSIKITVVRPGTADNCFLTLQ